MKIFEIHITGKDSSIIEEFHNLGYKTLTIQLLSPECEVVGYEYMCAIQGKFELYEQCLEFTLDLITRIKSEIVRVKIESPFYQEYIEKAIYAEVHFVPLTPGLLPTVYNANGNKYVTTERIYDKEEFTLLMEKYSEIKSEFELCLFDSNPEFDDRWLSFYKN